MGTPPQSVLNMIMTKPYYSGYFIIDTIRRGVTHGRCETGGKNGNGVPQ